MPTLESIAPAGDTDTDALPPLPGPLVPLLHEVRHALARLVADGGEHRIDLHALPLDATLIDQLLAFIGRGEVEARIDAMGPTRIHESATPGVWVVDYRDADDQRLALHLEIATVPQILRTDRATLSAGLQRLDAGLAGAGDPSPPS